MNFKNFSSADLTMLIKKGKKRLFRMTLMDSGYQKTYEEIQAAEEELKRREEEANGSTN